jgi:hypothetical protein
LERLAGRVRIGQVRVESRLANGRESHHDACDLARVGPDRVLETLLVAVGPLGGAAGERVG